MLAKMVRTFVGLMVFLSASHAEDDLNDIDDKILINLLNPSRTEKGEKLFEGDIVQAPDRKWHFDNSVKALPSRGALWRNRIIPYEFHSTVNKSSTDIIRQAMVNWESVTCLSFVPRKDEKQFLRFRTDGAGECINPSKPWGMDLTRCFTFVGKKQYQEGQDVNLGAGCVHLQIAMHEIGHSLGFFHEHSRKDRSSVIKIMWHNIQQGMASQFRPGNDDPRGVPYDVTSVMHYSPMSFSSRVFEKNTMVSLDPRLQTLIGRSRGITFRDAKLANIMYDCDDECSNRNNLHCQNEGYLAPKKKGSKECACVCPPNTKGKKCEIVAGDYYGDNPCEEEMTREGAIQTPGYPHRSPNESCSWIITAPAGKRVRVTFEDFSFRPRMDKPSTKYHGLCVYEQIEMRTGNTDEGDIYCGEDIQPGANMESTLNRFYILLRADSKAVGRGLKARVQHI